MVSVVFPDAFRYDCILNRVLSLQSGRGERTLARAGVTPGLSFRPRVLPRQREASAAHVLAILTERRYRLEAPVAVPPTPGQARLMAPARGRSSCSGAPEALAVMVARHRPLAAASSRSVDSIPKRI